MGVDIVHAFLTQPEKSGGVFGVDRIGSEPIQYDYQDEACSGSPLRRYSSRFSVERKWRAEYENAQRKSKKKALRAEHCNASKSVHFPFSIFHLSFFIGINEVADDSPCSLNKSKATMPPTLCRWGHDWVSYRQCAGEHPPPTLCRWRHDWVSYRQVCAPAPHRPCVGGGTTGLATDSARASTPHRRRVGGGGNKVFNRYCDSEGGRSVG
jgi:hypothetical protein